MVTKKFLLEVEEGKTMCHKCPFQTVDCTEEMYKVLDCGSYNLATMKIEPISYEKLREFANQYSHNIWEQLMQKYKNDKEFRIGANDVSDYVLNAILDTYKKIMEEA